MSQEDQRQDGPDQRSRPPETPGQRSFGFGNRPLSVYGVLVIGVATLLLLLAIIYFTATDRNKQQQRVCLTVDVPHAVEAIKQGQVNRLTVVVDADQRTPTSERFGPVLGRIDYVDGLCANLPQGLVGQKDLYFILGVVQIYNNESQGQQVEVRVDRTADLPAQLFTTPTLPATATPLVTPTIPPTAVATIPQIVATTPAASPAASSATPAATPKP
jgi:hypothetical protein